MGAFARDVDGELVAIDMWKMEWFNNPMVVEVMAIYKAMEVDACYCFRRAIIESDCNVLIEYRKDASFSLRNYSGDLIVGIRSLCGRFRDYRFDYIRSEGNVKAHKVANWHFWDQTGFR